jgi:rhamnose transport system ATP-binding protein
MGKNILELRNITKLFPGVLALKEVNFDLQEGEVHALVGENGAGKSTLVKIITGIYPPSEGKIIYQGREVVWNNPMESNLRGIAAIYQEPTIFPDLNVAENIFMGHQKYNKYTRKIRWGELYAKTRELMNNLNTNIKPRDRIIGLSLAERQLVEIAKALSMEAKIIIMDEPTSALSISESEELFGIIGNLKKNRKAILFISHRLEDVFTVADRVTVFRDGRLIGTEDIKNVTDEKLIQMMVGREVKDLFPKMEVERGEEVLRVEHLSKRGNFKNVSFSLHKGEILGFYGLVGAGRTEVAKAIFGMDLADEGKVFINGEEVRIKNPDEAIGLGIAYVPENRDEEGIILDTDITNNISLPILEKVSKFGWLDKDDEIKIAKQFSQMLEVKASGLDQKVLYLSGGNKQKVSLAKWLASDAKILLFDEPTKGIDVGAKAAVHKFISELASKGFAILMISSELPEIMGMSDNILVMHDGLVTNYFNKSEATRERILQSAISDVK